jgi:hypothetical protein
MKCIDGDEALLAYWVARSQVESVFRSETADMGKYIVKYASLNAVTNEIERVCAGQKLVVCQEPTMVEGLFAVVNTLLHVEGSRLEFAPMCLPLPKEAQALGSATTYLRRYSLVSQFGLAVEDDDGRAATVAAQTQPGRRTEAERLIRELIAQMDEEARKAFTSDFKDRFHSTLTDLPANRHGEALTWARQWVEDWAAMIQEKIDAAALETHAEEAKAQT